MNGPQQRRYMFKYSCRHLLRTLRVPERASVLPAKENQRRVSQREATGFGICLCISLGIGLGLGFSLGLGFDLGVRLAEETQTRANAKESIDLGLCVRVGLRPCLSPA